MKESRRFAAFKGYSRDRSCWKIRMDTGCSRQERCFDVNNTGKSAALYWWHSCCKDIIIRAYHMLGGHAMNLGEHLFHARKKKGLSQEEVAEKLGISRQTVSKWETDETLPDIRQSKRLAVLYGLSLDELVAFDIDIKEIQEAIDRTSEEISEKIDWTKEWSRKYPVLSQYQGKWIRLAMRRSWIGY